VTPSATIVVGAGRIVRIVATATGLSLPKAAREIDAPGRTLLPGLIDAHVHVAGWALPLFLRYGVTTVRDLHNDPGYILPLMRDDAPEQPRIVAAGALLDGTGSPWPRAIEVATLGEARSAVRRQVEAGVGVISVSTRLHPAMIAVIVQEARARGLPVAAQAGQATATEIAAAGARSLELLSGVSDAASDDVDRVRRAHDSLMAGWTASEREWPRVASDRLSQVAAALVRNGVTVVPALVLHEALARLDDPTLKSAAAIANVPPSVLASDWDPASILSRNSWTPAILQEFKRALPMQQQFVQQFVRAGGRVVAGTDTPQPYVVPGLSLHRELQLLVASGLSPAAAIRSATVDAAELLGVSDQTGSITVGKAADLMVVEGDPLTDIRATARIAVVVRAGRVVYRAP
jgi:imidazolonepropionase-like amidohydrolase